MLLKVKNFLEKNAKLAEKWKGPFVITKVHANNTVTITYPSGKKVVLGVGPRGVGPVVGGGPRNEETMVFLLGPGEIILSSLPGGSQQLVPGT